MQPRTADGGEGRSDEFDAWLALQRVTDGTRANIVADVVGHPKGEPGVELVSRALPAARRDVGLHMSTYATLSDKHFDAEGKWFLTVSQIVV